MQVEPNTSYLGGGGLGLDDNGRAYEWVSPSDPPALARVTTTGELDATYGSAGLRPSTEPEYRSRFAVLPTGTALLPSINGEGVTLTRLDDTGATDPDYRAQAWAPTDRCLPTIQPSVLSQPGGGAIVAGGNPGNGYGPLSKPRILIARYLGDGEDTTDVNPNAVVEDCGPCEDSIVQDCVPYETSLTIDSSGREVSGHIETQFSQCLDADFVLMDRRRGHLRRAAVTHATDIAGTHESWLAEYALREPRGVHGQVFIRLRNVGEASVCRRVDTSTVKIPKARTR
jgi:hypothetical protein